MGWETEELVPLDDFDGTVKASIWKIGMGGGVQIELTIEVHECYEPAGVGAKETKAWYSAGRKAWTIIDGGMRVLADQQGQKFHASSKYGMLLDQVTKTLKLESLIKKGEPEEAMIWVGERFRWKRSAASYSGLSTDEGEKRDVDTTVLLPIECRTPGAPASASPATAAAAVPGPATASAPAAPASEGVAEEDIVLLIGVAKGLSSDNMGHAVKLAAARDERLRDKASLMEAILSKNLIVDLEAQGKLKVVDGKYE